MVVLEMTRIRSIKWLCSIVTVTLVCGALLGASAATAASRSINCYKGSAVKIVKAASPKCAAGWSNKKPIAIKPTTVASTSKSLSINATYTGKISMLWSDSDVQATSVTATGTGTTLGLTQLVGTGSSSPSSTCDTISGAGSISDGSNTLKANFDPASQGCAKASAAPTTVAINGNAIITGGTGKYVGATGTLKFIGNFPVNSTAAGTKESGALTLTISGTFTTK